MKFFILATALIGTNLHATDREEQGEDVLAALASRCEADPQQLSYFPDPVLFLPPSNKALSSPAAFAEWWKKKYSQTITGFQSFKGLPCFLSTIAIDRSREFSPWASLAAQINMDEEEKLQSLNEQLRLLSPDKIIGFIDDACQDAAINGRLKTLKFLLAHPRATDHIKDLALITAAEHGHRDMVIYLLDQNADPSISDSFAFRRAVTLGHTEIVKLLLANEKVDPCASNDAPFKKAVFFGFEEILKLLLDDARFVLKAESVREAFGQELKYRQHEKPEIYDEIIISAAGAGSGKIINFILDDPNFFPSLQSIEKALIEAKKNNKLKIISDALRLRKAMPKRIRL
jgi:hypothetical protein